MTTQFTKLTDPQWAAISEFFEDQRKRKTDLRAVVDAILYLLRTGMQWRNLPEGNPKWQTVYYYYRKWGKRDVFLAINDKLNKLDREREGREAVPSLLNVDSQSVKLAPFCNIERGLDAGKKVNGRKRQMLVDTGGRIWAVFVHRASEHDATGGQPLLEQIEYFDGRLKKILGDTHYGGLFADAVKSRGLEYETASRPETAKGFVPIAIRWVVERSYGWFNFFRRLCKDFERLPKTAENMMVLANSQIMLNRLFPI
jgi:transposase